MAIFDDENNNNNNNNNSPFSRSSTTRSSSMDSTKEGNIHIGSGVSVNGEINAPNEVIVNGKHTGKVAAGKISVKNGGGVDGETAVETAEIEGNYDGNLQVAGTLSVSSSGIAKGEIRYKDLEIALGGKISGTIAEMSDEDFQKSKIKLVKDNEETGKKSGGGFFGTAKEEDN
jgi:cytoskeletal protein CcmA (bactofilin family)